MYEEENQSDIDVSLVAVSVTSPKSQRFVNRRLFDVISEVMEGDKPSADALRRQAFNGRCSDNFWQWR
jgi:hypothetical protein